MIGTIVKEEGVGNQQAVEYLCEKWLMFEQCQLKGSPDWRAHASVHGAAASTCSQSMT